MFQGGPLISFSKACLSILITCLLLLQFKDHFFLSSRWIYFSDLVTETFLTWISCKTLNYIVAYRKEHLTGCFKCLYTCFQDPSLMSIPIAHTLFKVTVWTCWRITQKLVRRPSGRQIPFFSQTYFYVTLLNTGYFHDQWECCITTNRSSTWNCNKGIVVLMFWQLTLSYSFFAVSIQHRQVINCDVTSTAIANCSFYNKLTKKGQCYIGPDETFSRRVLVK